MKIRIKGNSLRYRLTRSDVAEVAKSGFIQDKIDFGAQQLVYALRITNDEQLSSTYMDNTITLFMPKVMIDELITADTVGFDNNMNGLHLLVEKDFTCLDNVAEDQSDNYPNPIALKVL